MRGNIKGYLFPGSLILEYLPISTKTCNIPSKLRVDDICVPLLSSLWPVQFFVEYEDSLVALYYII